LALDTLILGLQHPSYASVYRAVKALEKAAPGEALAPLRALDARLSSVHGNEDVDACAPRCGGR
jgi:hypothetical protein